MSSFPCVHAFVIYTYKSLRGPEGPPAVGEMGCDFGMHLGAFAQCVCVVRNIRISLSTMPPRPLDQLAPDEKTLLVHAAKLIGALKACAATPPTTQEHKDYWKSCLGDELVRTLFIYVI